jgi:hypothetical protein
MLSVHLDIPLKITIAQHVGQEAKAAPTYHRNAQIAEGNTRYTNQNVRYASQVFNDTTMKTMNKRCYNG